MRRKILEWHCGDRPRSRVQDRFSKLDGKVLKFVFLAGSEGFCEVCVYGKLLVLYSTLFKSTRRIQTKDLKGSNDRLSNSPSIGKKVVTSENFSVNTALNVKKFAEITMDKVGKNIDLRNLGSVHKCFACVLIDLFVGKTVLNDTSWHLNENQECMKKSRCSHPTQIKMASVLRVRTSECLWCTRWSLAQCQMLPIVE